MCYELKLRCDHRAALHARPAGEDSEATTQQVIRTALAARSLETLGMALHSLGDSFAHRQLDNEGWMYPTGRGHGLDGTKPDRIVHRPELYEKYEKTLVTTLAQARGEPMSEEQASAFAQSMAAMAQGPRAEARAKTEARVRKERSQRVGISPIGHRPAGYGGMDGEFRDQAEDKIAKALIARAQAVVLTEGSNGDVLLRPERAETGHFAGTSRVDGARQLADFWKDAYKAPIDPETGDEMRIQKSLYKNDLSLSPIINTAKEFLSLHDACKEGPCWAFE